MKFNVRTKTSQLSVSQNLSKEEKKKHKSEFKQKHKTGMKSNLKTTKNNTAKNANNYRIEKIT